MDEAGEKLLEKERRLEEAARHKQDAKDTAIYHEIRLKRKRERVGNDTG